MNEIVAEHPGREIHVVLDNLNTHKPKDDRWLKRHPLVHFHFTPTYSSWLNQVEIWFSILSRQALRGASFTSPAQLRQAIDNFVAAYNEKAAPFEWRKAVVFPSAPKSKCSDLCKQVLDTCGIEPQYPDELWLLYASPSPAATIPFLPTLSFRFTKIFGPKYFCTGF